MTQGGGQLLYILGAENPLSPDGIARFKLNPSFLGHLLLDGGASNIVN
jgi:hypothetical protein